MSPSGYSQEGNISQTPIRVQINNLLSGIDQLGKPGILKKFTAQKPILTNLFPYLLSNNSEVITTACQNVSRLFKYLHYDLEILMLEELGKSIPTKNYQSSLLIYKILDHTNHSEMMILLIQGSLIGVLERTLRSVALDSNLYVLKNSIDNDNPLPDLHFCDMVGRSLLLTNFKIYLIDDMINMGLIKMPDRESLSFFRYLISFPMELALKVYERRSPEFSQHALEITSIGSFQELIQDDHFKIHDPMFSKFLSLFLSRISSSIDKDSPGIILGKSYIKWYLDQVIRSLLHQYVPCLSPECLNNEVFETISLNYHTLGVKCISQLVL